MSGTDSLSVADALQFLDTVKIQFSGRPEVYNSFLEILKEFKAEKSDIPEVISRVTGLFQGYPPLIEGFSTFVPSQYRMQVLKAASESKSRL